MKTKKTILEQYTKYLQLINECKKEELPTNFKKFTDFLKANTDNKRFQGILYLDCIHKTLVQVSQREVRLKELSQSWSSTAAKKCWEKVNKLNSIRKEEEDTSSVSISDRYKILLGSLFNFMEEQTDPCLKLYMYMAHESKDSDGQKLYGSEMLLVDKLLKADSEEEIEALLQPKTEEKKDFQTRFVCKIPINKLELFKLFNPKDLVETEECYLKLEEMVNQNEISYDDYCYVRDILLSPRKSYYTNGGKWEEPTTKLFSGPQIIDGIQFLEEEELKEACSE